MSTLRRVLCAVSLRGGGCTARLKNPLMLCTTTTFPAESLFATSHYSCSKKHFSSSKTASQQKEDVHIFDLLHKIMARLDQVHSPQFKTYSSKKEAESSSVRSKTLRKLATDLCDTYRGLQSDEQTEILKYFCEHCSPSPAKIAAAVEEFDHSPARLVSLRHACTPAYESLFQCLVTQNARGGLYFVLSLREHLLQFLRTNKQQNDLWDQATQLDLYLRNFLWSWFSPGMLEIKRITYEGTSAAVIERIITKEAVHPVQNLDDLRLRFGSSRRVFAFFHPLLPDEPLIFVHVSLQDDDIPSGMSQVMKEENHQVVDPRVAAFYSISNGHAGLAGLGLGEFLIKETVNLLRGEFLHMDTFVTLSPIPRFRHWLEDKAAHNNNSKFSDDALVTSHEAQKAAAALKCDTKDVLDRILALEPSGLDDDALMPFLMKLMARYLVLEKHRLQPLDPVARFHTGNGAEMFRLNYKADMSSKGWHNSFGMMINYRYNLDNVDENQLLFESDNRLVLCQGVSEWID